MANNLKYTIKKDAEKGIYLLNEHGEEVAATDILEKCGAARVFAFDGKMGAGKTTFIKCLCEAMGTEDVVTLAVEPENKAKRLYQRLGFGYQRRIEIFNEEYELYAAKIVV